MDEKTGIDVASEDAVIDANGQFYSALQARSIGAMSRLWLHQDWVVCVHPGSQGITGWKNVQQSWVEIFANTRHLKVQVHNLTLQLCGPVAWVTCVEEITSDSGEGLVASLAQATHIFMKVAKCWKLAHHHASAIPMSPNDPVSERVQ